MPARQPAGATHPDKFADESWLTLRGYGTASCTPLEPLLVQLRDAPCHVILVASVQVVLLDERKELVDC